MLQPRDVAVLGLPVITGLNGVLWAEMVTKSGGFAASICAAVSSFIVVAVLLFLGSVDWVRPSFASVATLVTLNVLTSLLWLFPMTGGTPYVSLSLIEGAWPVFSVAFTWILLGRMELDLMSAIGGVLIIAGAALVFHQS